MIARRVIAAVIRLLSPFRRQRLSRQQTEVLIRQLFGLVNAARWESAGTGREYFDTQWRQNVGDVPPEVWLSSYRREWFDAALRPVRRQLEAADTPREMIAQAAEIAAKEVRNGGRRTVLRAVRENPKQVARWARYDPVPPTCAFCLMLISRGPVYHSRESAGGRDLWHPGCTCQVIPVFNADSWDGREQYLDADRLWRDATRGYRGTAALKAFRRAVDAQQRRAESTRDAAAA